MSDPKFRYDFINDFSKHLVDCLELGNLVNIDLADNISYKIAGFNVELDAFVNTVILRNSKIGPLIKIPLFKKILYYFLEQKEREYELSLSFHKSGRNIVRKYTHIYFATMNNYLNPLLPLSKKEDDYIFILPAESKSWINYKKILENGINHVFIQDVIEFDKNKLDSLRDQIKVNYRQNRHEILHYRYNLSYKEPSLKRFIFDFLPQHILVINGLERFIKKISSENTQFYIARDRRALENAFIQIGNKINGNTHMYIHGMFSFEFNKYLWGPGRYNNCKNVYVWGGFHRALIEKRQKKLNEKTPNIIISGSNFLKKISKTNNSNILFLSQPFINKYIPFLSKNLPKNHKIIIRLHPGDKDKIQKFKEYESQNFQIDDLENELGSTLSNSSLVIAYSSSGVLEAIYNDIPTLILNFKELKDVPNIYKESLLNENGFDNIVLTESNFKHKIDKIFADEDYKMKVLSVNKKMFSNIVEVECYKDS